MKLLCSEQIACKRQENKQIQSMRCKTLQN